MPVMKKITRNYGAEIKSIDSETHELTAAVSTDDVDRYGDIIEPSGIDMKNFNKNPIIPWGHDYDALPVGKAIKTWVEGNKLMMRIKFAVEQYDFANTVFKLYAAGFLRAFSIGFIPKEWIDEKDENDRWVRTYKKIELIETSAVTMPANPSALALALSKGIISKDEVKGFGEQAKDILEDDERSETDKLLDKIFVENHEITKTYRKNFEKIRKILGVDPTDDENETTENTMKALEFVICAEQKKSTKPKKAKMKVKVVTPPKPKVARPATDGELSDIASKAAKKSTYNL